MSYRNYVVGGGAPKIEHKSKDIALTEAQRLAKKENAEVLTLEVVGRTTVEQLVIQHDIERRTINVENDFTESTFEDSDDVSIIVVNHSRAEQPSEALFGIPPLSVNVFEDKFPAYTGQFNRFLNDDCKIGGSIR